MKLVQIYFKIFKKIQIITNFLAFFPVLHFASMDPDIGENEYGSDSGSTALLIAKTIQEERQKMTCYDYVNLISWHIGVPFLYLLMSKFTIICSKKTYWKFIFNCLTAAVLSCLVLMNVILFNYNLTLLENITVYARGGGCKKAAGPFQKDKNRW